jgi:hypothetical protein
LSAFDVIFLSYDEPAADRNWLRVLGRFPAARRVHGVRGLHAAHRECARVARTEHFYLIDADSELLPDARLEATGLELSSPHRAYLWRSRNAVNGLVSGFGGVKLIGRASLAAFTSELDLTVGAAEFTTVDETASINRFNQSPMHAWRGAFRECARLAGGVLRRHTEEERARRLRVWTTEGADMPYGEWCVLGARQGVEFGRRHHGRSRELALLNDYDALAGLFRETQGIGSDA